MTLQEVAERILSTKGKIAVFGHVHPDCDAIGSMCAFAEGLKQSKKKFDLFADGKLADATSAIFSTQIINNNDCDVSQYKLVVILDLNAPYRLGKYENVLSKAKNVIRIDHHHGGDEFVKDFYLDEQSSSSCEIMYELLKYMNVNIDKTIATYLYAGIATDTNSFINSNVRANTYKVAEKLFKAGADVALVNKACFRSTTKSGLELTKILYKKQKFALNGKFAYVIINRHDFKKSCSSYLDAENFSQLLDSISGTMIAICATEREKGVFKLSIRSNNSKNDYALKFALDFAGGGHKQAAGATIVINSDKKLEKKLVATAKKILENTK